MLRAQTDRIFGLVEVEDMKIAVMGAGAVGCFYGGMLARAGHEVVLIGRARAMS